MGKIKIGLLPLYVKLYDDVWPSIRPRMDAFYKNIAKELASRGVEVLTSDACRLESEFREAIHGFEQGKADAIVTLHLAYSPSLESEKPIANTYLPIIVLDTTETYDFSGSEMPDELIYNHGIHGVQDMCCMLTRNGKKYAVEAGHWKKSDVLDRVVCRIKGLKMAQAMRHARIGRIGSYFAGMGDFAVAPARLKADIGITPVLFDFSKTKDYYAAVTKAEVLAEMEADRGSYDLVNVDELTHERITKAGLAVRKWAEAEKLTGFTVNFMDITAASDFECMPFCECCKALASGVGYAGEGDILTAALCGAVISQYPESTFAEMFCPDWKNNLIFFSHMGEVNPDLLAEKPKMLYKEFTFTDASDTAFLSGTLKAGEATLVNLAPVGNGEYRLVLACGMMKTPKADRQYETCVSGWFDPLRDIGEFLTDYSNLGATHHSVIVYGDARSALKVFGEQTGWKVADISKG